MNDLPMAENRDLAWELIRQQGESIALDATFAVTSQRTVEAVLRHPDVFSSKRAFDALNSPIPMPPLTFDPPEQTRFRRILQPFFSPRAIRPLEPVLRRHVVDLIEPLVERGECDFVADVAVPFPVQTFLTFFGLPMDHLDQFLVWKDAILDQSDPQGAGKEDADAGHAVALFTYLGELVARRRGVPGEDILSALLCAEGDDAMTDEEVVGLCFLFVLAGLDTVTGALGMGMERLAKSPEHQRELAGDPGLVPAAVEELVRLDPPAPFTPRVTTRAAVVDGHTVPEASMVSAYLAVANRDEALRRDPLVMDFHRGENPHASFGLGVHRCLGAHLARLEMAIVYEEWHKRIPSYEVAPGTTPRVKWPRGTLELESLRLRFPAGGAG
ncbi:cytochrome P450 [Trujillonella humicola]|uniref:cytochrome P450 n=1 Tax=Trujillonella humicola TaxID=3383699 RepID=UPI00390678C1